MGMKSVPALGHSHTQPHLTNLLFAALPVPLRHEPNSSSLCTRISSLFWPLDACS